MKKLIFRPSDFEGTYGHYQKELHEAYCKLAQAKHDAWLKELMDGAKVVYGNDKDGLWDSEKHQLDTHQALLIDIREVEKKCERHEPEENWFFKSSPIKCRHCTVYIETEWKEKA